MLVQKYGHKRSLSVDKNNWDKPVTRIIYKQTFCARFGQGSSHQNQPKSYWMGLTKSEHSSGQPLAILKSSQGLRQQTAITFTSTIAWAKTAYRLSTWQREKDVTWSGSNWKSPYAIIKVLLHIIQKILQRQHFFFKLIPYSTLIATIHICSKHLQNQMAQELRCTSSNTEQVFVQR